ARNGDKGKLRFLLRGIAWCRVCRQKLTAETHPRGSYYRCPSHVYAKRCGEPYVRAKELENQLESVYERLQQPREALELLREEVAVIAQRREEIARKELGSLKQKIAQVEAKELELGDRYV